jgi:hypothetical protein
MYYLDEYNINLSIEEALISFQYDGYYEPEPLPPRIPVGDLKQDLPVYLFLIVFSALTALSLALLNL